VDFDDGVVDVDEHWAVDPGDQRGAIAQPGQHSRRDGVELADVAEGEFTQERPQRRRCVRAIEEGAHRAVSQQGHVVDAVGSGDHARDQRGHLRPGVGALVGGQPQMLVGHCRQVALLGQRDHRDQAGAGHQIGVVKDRRRYGSTVR
jgi:hypothetical protein